MDLKIDNDKIKFDNETKKILKMFANSNVSELGMFSINVLCFVPELMKTTSNGGYSFVNKLNRIDSVETEKYRVLNRNENNEGITKKYFEFYSTLNFIEKGDNLEISVTLNGYNKTEENGKTYVDLNNKITSCSKLIYNKVDHSGMLIEKLGEPNEQKIIFIDKDGIVVDCKNLIKFGQKNTEKTSNTNTENIEEKPEKNKTKN